MLYAIWRNANWRKASSKMMPLFERYIGVDYSGAETAESSLKTIRVYVATPATDPQEEPTPSGPPMLPNQPRYWSRRRLASWLRDRLYG